MSYSCCTTFCEHCAEPICKCSCEAGRNSYAEVADRIHFTSALTVVMQHMAKLESALRDRNEYKLVTLQLTPHGDVFTGQLRIGMAPGETFGDPLALWDILKKARNAH